eukprot:TRINITY_DN128785_c0_g1_i1.p2 TRINITY_DN128785_c0_g1~~TRINITY_DN128785_c0_g1_i1.p2  ORF type:complete len:110 (-),score=0.54 TRINITY_DN128785_c0_g1_i1:7-336(-)
MNAHIELQHEQHQNNLSFFDDILLQQWILVLETFQQVLEQIIQQNILQDSIEIVQYNQIIKLEDKTKKKNIIKKTTNIQTQSYKSIGCVQKRIEGIDKLKRKELREGLS